MDIANTLEKKIKTEFASECSEVYDGDDEEDTLENRF